MGLAAETYQVGHGQAFRGGVVLGEQRQFAGYVFGRQAVNVLAVQQHRALCRCVDAGQAVQQGGFAATVGADNGGHLASGQGHAQVFGHGELAMGQGNAVCRQGRGLCRAHVRLLREGFSRIHSR